MVVLPMMPISRIQNRSAIAIARRRFQPYWSRIGIEMIINMCSSTTVIASASSVRFRWRKRRLRQSSLLLNLRKHKKHSRIKTRLVAVQRQRARSLMRRLTIRRSVLQVALMMLSLLEMCHKLRQQPTIPMAMSVWRLIWRTLLRWQTSRNRMLWLRIPLRNGWRKSMFLWRVSFIQCVSIITVVSIKRTILRLISMRRTTLTMELQLMIRFMIRQSTGHWRIPLQSLCLRDSTNGRRLGWKLSFPMSCAIMLFLQW